MANRRPLRGAFLIPPPQGAVTDSDFHHGLLGRQGLFAHDNTHHTLSMAYKLTDCLDDQGELNRTQWAADLESFETHVVED